MSENTADEVARELARTAVAKAAEVSGKAAVDAATFTLGIAEARRDIERLDSSFTQYKIDDVARWKEFSSERKAQFRWILTLLLPLLAGMIMNVVALLLHK